MEKCARFRRPIGGIHTYLPMALIAISLLAPPCTAAPAGPSAATVRQQAITAAWAKCAQRTEAAWKDVLAAEKAEIASLQKATNAAMKSGDASAVVATYKYAAVVRQRLNAESAELPFPAQFSMGTNAGALTPPVRAAELVRNAAVQKALGDYASARLAFRKAVVAADESEVKALQARVRADMRAADAKAVVADVSLLGRAKRALARAARPGGGGRGNGPKSSFIGKGGNATRIVYILDHEGSMLENFQSLKSHLHKSIAGLSPVQSFAVIVFRKNYKILGPNRLVHATLRNKEEFFKRLRTVAPAGAAEYRYSYFARPFAAAFHLHPQIIYFLTKGAFDPKVIGYVKSLNKDKEVHIYTYAFTLQDPVSRKNLQIIAKENGGQYKYISRQEANQ